MALEPSLLIDNERSPQQVKDYLADGEIKIYLDRAGSISPPPGIQFTVESIDWYREYSAYVAINRLNQIIKPRVSITQDIEEADITITQGSDLLIEGLGDHLMGLFDPGIGAIFLRSRSELDNFEYLSFILRHELVHAFGLEHPWDPYDGDVYGDNQTFSSDETLTAYRLGPSSSLDYREFDIQALQQIWGESGEMPGNMIAPIQWLPENYLSLAQRATEAGSAVIGSGGVDLLGASASNDVLTGGTDSDVFLLDVRGSSKKNRKAKPDVITDFSPDQGDLVAISQGLYKPKGASSIAFVSSKKESTQAQSNGYWLVYEGFSGKLLYDQNGRRDGLGRGDVIVELAGAPALNSSHFATV